MRGPVCQLRIDGYPGAPAPVAGRRTGSAANVLVAGTPRLCRHAVLIVGPLAIVQDREECRVASPMSSWVSQKQRSPAAALAAQRRRKRAASSLSGGAGQRRRVLTASNSMGIPAAQGSCLRCACPATLRGTQPRWPQCQCGGHRGDAALDPDLPCRGGLRRHGL